MRHFRTIILAAAALVFAACKQAPVESIASAVLPEQAVLTFAATSAEPQTMWVYADGDWVADVAVDWLTVSPSSGSGNVEVTFTVSDNVKNGAQDAPRSTYVRFKGGSLERSGQTLISQKGDTYLGSPEISVTEVLALEDESVAKIPSSTVMAVSTKGLILSDGTSNMYAVGAPGVKPGDVVFVNGTKTTLYGYPAFILDECNVLSSGTPAYPAEHDITSSIDGYKPTGVEYFTVSGSLVTTTIRIPGAMTRVTAVDVPESLGFASSDLHKVKVSGYFIGVVNNKPSFVCSNIVTGGLDDSLIPYPVKWHLGDAKINFNTSWPDQYDDQGNKIDEDQRNVEAVQGLGYLTYVPGDFTEDNSSTKVYPHRDVSGNNPRITGAWTGDYWLFTGLGAIKAGSEVQITFEARVSATNPKYWKLQYYDGTVWKTAGEEKTTNETGSALTYTHQMNADGSTNVQVKEVAKFNKNNEHCLFRFLCMTNYQANGSGPLSVRNGGSARISVTDPASEDWQPGIVIVKEGDGVEIADTEPETAQVVLSSELLTFEGVPAGPQTLTVKSDHDFTLSTEADWITLDKTEGVANESTTIQVTCAPSTLSTLRQDQIKLVSADTKIYIDVVQSANGKELEPFISIVGGNSVDLDADAESFKVQVQANVEYDVVIPAEVDWIAKTPFTKATVDVTELELFCAANTGAESRTATLLVTNEENHLVAPLIVTQAGYVAPPSGIIFQDNFDWMKPYVEYYNTHAGKTIGRSVEDNNASGNAPNAYTETNLKACGLMDAFAAQGYVDLNPSAKVLYPQDCYWKMGKTSAHTGLQLPPVNHSGKATISFDWSPHMTADGVIDKVNVVVEVVTGGTSVVSAPFANDWQNGHLKWKTVSTTIDITPESKIIIRPEYLTDHDGIKQMRWYLDNIVIKEPEPTLKAQWYFDTDPSKDAYTATFGTTAGTFGNKAGDNGMYIDANGTCVGSGRITFVQVDKTSFPGTDNPKYYVGGTGHPYVTGVWPGDYWLFTATDGKEYPAGTKLHIKYLTRISGTGQKYWILEYWDGAAWQPGAELKTETETGTSAQYNFIEPTSNTTVEGTFTLAAACTVMQFRMRCVANWQSNGKGPLAAPNGGTCRLAADDKDLAGTSPVFEVVD